MHFAVESAPESLLGCNKKILVVDDEPAMTAAISRVLSRAGYEVKTANDGFAAGSFVQAFRPALMTVDLKMPGVRGLEVISFVKSDQNIHETKVLVISAEPIEMLRESVLFGADGVLSKPFDNNELLQSVNTLMAAV
jgi:two-component system, OmpR family, response regulator VicR